MSDVSNNSALVPKSSEVVQPVRHDVAAALREFARAVRHIHDLSTFLQVFQVGLEKTGIWTRNDFALTQPDASEADQFSPGRLTTPITTETSTIAHGLISPGPKQYFDAEDLHLLAGLSELLGAALGVAQRLQIQENALAALKAVLSFAPVGICGFSTDGRVEVINTLARGWLGLAEGDALATALPTGVTLEELNRGSAFHLRVAGRLLFCEVRPAAAANWAVLLMTDLTPEQGRLLDSLSREVYRGIHLRRPLHFVLLERAQPAGALLASMASMRSAIGRAAIVGPYDAARVGIIFPESSWSGAVLNLRRVAAIHTASEVRVGFAALTTFQEKPESLIESALNMRQTLAAVVRPRVLVHDEYRGVGDALRLVLGSDCDVTGSTDAAEAHRLVEEQHFDAVLADLNAAGDGQELVAQARARNNGVKAFFLSSTLPGGSGGRLGAVGDVPVFSKPFDVEIVRDQILASLGEKVNTPQV
jgi:CheY-like chemotaxis protein